MTGAIFCDRRPATIMRSAWRGEGRKTSAPKRATSKRAAAMDIISMAQQARPKPRGQIELRRAQFTALSSVVKMMPSSSRSLPKSSGLVRVTFLPRDVLIGPRTDIFAHWMARDKHACFFNCADGTRGRVEAGFFEGVADRLESMNLSGISNDTFV